MDGGLLEGGEAAADPPLLAVFCVVFFRWCLKVEGFCVCPGGGAEDLVWKGEPCVV